MCRCSRSGCRSGWYPDTGRYLIGLLLVLLLVPGATGYRPLFLQGDDPTGVLYTEEA